MCISFLQVLNSKEPPSIYKPVILLLCLSFINMSLRTSISVSRVVWPLQVQEQNVHGRQGKYKGTNYELHVIIPCLKISQNFFCVCKCHYISICFFTTISAQVCQSHSDYLAQKATELTSLKDKG